MAIRARSSGGSRRRTEDDIARFIAGAEESSAAAPAPVSRTASGRAPKVVVVMKMDADLVKAIDAAAARSKVSRTAWVSLRLAELLGLAD